MAFILGVGLAIQVDHLMVGGLIELSWELPSNQACILCWCSLCEVSLKNGELTMGSIVCGCNG
jgi:hypothetical protein